MGGGGGKGLVWLMLLLFAALGQHYCGAATGSKSIYLSIYLSIFENLYDN